MSEEVKVEIDEGLYSRQLYVLGHEAMQRMGQASVLVSGMKGLGAEIAKNVVLGGVKAVTVQDEHKASPGDLSSQFFLREEDIGRNRAEASVSELSELNSYVRVDAFAGPLMEEFLTKFQVIVLTNSSLEEQVKVNDVCRRHGLYFIVADTKGVFGQIFCDFGETFSVVDTNGEAPQQFHIDSIAKGEETNVMLCTDARHTFEDGDYVTFSEVQGMTELNRCPPQQIKSLGPHSIGIGDTSSFGDYKNGGLVTYVKMPVQMEFMRLSDALEQPTFETRIFNEKRLRQMHLAFRALHEYTRQKNALPTPWSQTDAEQFLKVAASVNESLTQPVESLDPDLLTKFAFSAAGDLSPIQGIIGGNAAQEVMKAISGKFTPIRQWLYYDAVECLPLEDPRRLQDTCQPMGSRYDGQIAVFGKEFQEKIAKTRFFLVGAGAIGCEMLKNWAMMGIGQRKDGGHVTLTDMDTIEKSNLNRQFLFRPNDVEKPKSETAAAAVQRMNPGIDIEPHENRVGPETEKVYNDDFFEKLTAVVNALDNVEARKYVDGRCVYYRKAMFDSGTLGARCSLQVVLPHLTQCYSDTRDAPEKSYPMCTLKHFPIAIEHTLQWARDEFEGLFKQSIDTANKYLMEPDFIEKTRKLDGCKPMEILRELKGVLVDMAPKSFQDCVVWARKKFQNNYANQICQLLHVFPADHVTKTGAPFWSGQKRCPVPLEFSVENSTHLDYVEAAANLVAQVFSLPTNRDRSEIARLAAAVQVEDFQPNSRVHIPTTDEEAKEETSKGLDAEALEEMEQLIRALPGQGQVNGQSLSPMHFEKDDDSNFHMDFIVAASNLRAENYGISPADRHKSKLIAGRIIPAIATTTSVVVGFVCLELYKWIQGFEKIELYKNGYINLATISFVFTRPTPASKKKYGDKEFTIWDRFEVDEEMTLKQLIDHFKDKHGLMVDMVGYGPSVLYSAGLTANPTERLALPVSEAVELVSKKPIPAHARSVVLDLGCCDENDQDVEVPSVRYRLVRP